MKKYTWARYGGYDVTTKGDRRFSPFYCCNAAGIKIEEYYQLDVKGYRGEVENFMDAHGLPCKRNLTREEQYQLFKAAYKEWADAHPDLMRELAVKAAGTNYVISDMTAKDPNLCQARALAELLNTGDYGDLLVDTAIISLNELQQEIGRLVCGDNYPLILDDTSNMEGSKKSSLRTLAELCRTLGHFGDIIGAYADVSKRVIDDESK